MAAKPKMMAGFGDPLLPLEIWREILARLPVKSILRCRSVCKSWYSLISCPNFISHHSLTNLHNNNGNRFLLYHQDSSYSSHDMDIESREHDEDYSPDRLIGENFVIVGSCNGLICLCERDYRDGLPTVTFLIWNPTIRKIVELPSLNYHFGAYPLVGFGFDSSSSDYKVLCNLCGYHILEESTLKNVGEIFDLSKGVWRRISPPLPSPRVIISREPECYVKGAVHWSVATPDRPVTRSILSFSMSDESFREIRMPDCAEFTRCGDGYHIETRSVTFGGLVHVIMWKERDDYDDDDVPESSVWTMKEYGVAESWVKVSNIDLQSVQLMSTTHLSPRYFILWAKHEVLMLHHPPLDEDDGLCSKQDLVLYNTESKKSKRLFTINKFAHNTRLYRKLCLYKESLVLM